MSYYLINASHVHVIVHGGTFEKKLLFSSGLPYNVRKSWNK